MRGGFREGEYDKKITKLLRKNWRLRDRRSKIVHNLNDEPHLLLFGWDMERQREAIMARDCGQCVNANKKAFRSTCEVVPELDHIQGGLTGRCDCEHNLQPLCRACHRKKHGREVMSAKIDAAREGRDGR